MKNIFAPGLGILALISVSALALASTEAIPIADVVDVVKSAFHTPPGGAEATAAVGDKLLADEAIRTEPESAIEMSFPDGATLRLEAESDLVLDSYVFDPNALKSAAAISISSGLARYTTGGESIDDSGVEFTTPVATVGIRGTDIVVSVGANGATVVDVLSGKVNVKPKENQGVDAEEGQSVLVETVNQPPQVGAIGDFATAAGVPAAAPPVENYDGPSEKGRAPQNDNSPAGGTDSGGGSSGGGGGGDPGGGSDSDGDGNAGHGNNEGKHDNDNPGGGQGKNNK